MESLSEKIENLSLEKDGKTINPFTGRKIIKGGKKEKQVKVMLEKVYKKFSEEDFDFEALEPKFVLAWDKLSDIKEGKKKVWVIMPYSYDSIELLDKNHYFFSKEFDYLEEEGNIGAFYEYKGLAVTGTGADAYYILNKNLYDEIIF